MSPDIVGVLRRTGISYGTTLPASPADGQEAVLVDSTTAPTYQWRFRYNASNSSAYKWEFVGGTDVYVPITTAQSTTSTVGYQDLATVGPSFVVPRAGNYNAVASALTAHTVVGTTTYIVFAVAAGTMVEQSPAVCFASNQWTAHAPLYHRFAALTASNEIRVRYYNGTAGTAQWWMRWLQVEPVAVA